MQRPRRHLPPKPSLTLPGAEFIYPIGGGARFRPEASSEAEHRHGACRLRAWRRGVFLPLQPGQQLPGVCIVQLPHLLNDHFDCAHGGSVASVEHVANSALGNKVPRLARRAREGQAPTMSTVQGIEAAITQLEPRKIHAVADWLQQDREELWDKQIAADAKAGKLDSLIKKAKAGDRAGKATPFP